MAFARRSRRSAAAEEASDGGRRRSSGQLAWSPPVEEEVDGGAAADERPPDPEAELERARGHAWRALNRRDRTVAELRRLLADKEVDIAAGDVVVGELVAGGYLDDASYAARFFEDRTRLDGWGAGRVERRLLELGIDPDLVATTLSTQDAEAEVARALGVLRRRFPAPPDDRRERDRALGVLLRKGYGYDAALAALRRHADEI